MLKKIKKVVFPVGGLGTRFLPATKCLPKEMLPVFNKPIIQYAFEEAVQAGIEEFIFITGRNKNAINNHFDHVYELQHVLNQKEKTKELKIIKGWIPEAGQIAFIRQQEPLGLGHAVWCARNFIGDEAFAVILADELLHLPPKGFLTQMLQDYYDSKEEANFLGICEIAKEQVKNYGIIDYELRQGKIKVKDMIEKPEIEASPSNYAIIGRYILQPEIFSFLEHQKSGAGGEIQLTDAMSKLLRKQNFYATEFKGSRFDCGNPMGYLEANIAFGFEASPKEVKSILKKYDI